MSRTRKQIPRKYQGTWEELKAAKHLSIVLDKAYLLSTSQIRRQYNTLRRALSKEKYIDHEFKDSFPDSEITSHLTDNHGEIIFDLNPDTYDISGMF